MQQPPAGVLSLKGSELKVKAQNQVAAAPACCSRMRLFLLGWLGALGTSQVQASGRGDRECGPVLLKPWCMQRSDAGWEFAVEETSTGNIW